MMQGYDQDTFTVETHIINSKLDKSMKDQSLFDFISRTRFKSGCFDMLVGVMNHKGEVYRTMHLSGLDAYISITDYMLLLGFKNISSTDENGQYDVIFKECIEGGSN